jgi:hypothetical protein
MVCLSIVCLHPVSFFYMFYAAFIFNQKRGIPLEFEAHWMVEKKNYWKVYFYLYKIVS